MDKTVPDSLSPPCVTLRTPLTERPWRALWDWLLAPVDQKNAASVEELGENHILDDSDSHEEETGNAPSAR